MADHRVLLDTFADARRTWDDLVALQPDVVAGSGNLKRADFVELERRVDAHRMAIDAFADALESGPADEPGEGPDAEAFSRSPAPGPDRGSSSRKPG